MSGASNSTVNVGPLAEYMTAQPLRSNVSYGDAAHLTAARHLNTDQFGTRVSVHSPAEDTGWMGPLGSYSNSLPSGSLYGYGVPSDYPQY